MCASDIVPRVSCFLLRLPRFNVEKYWIGLGGRHDKFDTRMVKTGDEVRTVNVGWVNIRVVGRDELTDTDTIIDHYHPITPCSDERIIIIIIIIRHSVITTTFVTCH